MTEDDEKIESLLTQIEKEFKSNQHFKTTIICFAGLLGENRNPEYWFEDRKILQSNGFVNMINQEDCIEIIYQIIKQFFLMKFLMFVQIIIQHEKNFI